MSENAYDYILEFLRKDGVTRLGCFPMEVDWVPAREALLFALLRQGHISSLERTPHVRVEPEWQVDGERICGFHMTAGLAGGGTSSLAFSLEYFRAQVSAASRQLMVEKRLKVGDLFEYSVAARPRAAEPGQAACSRRISIEAVDSPVRIADADLRDHLDGALRLGTIADADAFPVFIDWRVLEEVSALTRQARPMETGGVLVGHLRRDVSVPEVFLEITGQVPAHATGKLTSLSFTPEVWSDVQSAIDGRGVGEAWLGWWHSHSWGWQKPAVVDASESDHDDDAALSFFSADDCLLHRSVFPRAYSIGLLIADAPRSGMSWTTFGWHAGRVAARAFHVVNSPWCSDTPPKAGRQLVHKSGENHAPIR